MVWDISYVWKRKMGIVFKKVKVKFNLFIVFDYVEAQLEKIFIFALKNK